MKASQGRNQDSADNDHQANCLAEGLKNSTCTATDADCICADATLMANVNVCSLGACTVIEGLRTSWNPTPHNVG